MSKTHAHIGTGNFGLGFVGYFSKQSNLKTVLFNRTPADEKSRDKNNKLKEDKYYKIDYFVGEEADAIDFDSLSFFDRKNTETLVETIADPETILLTTSVGQSHLPEISSFIREGINTRPAHSPTLHILACENGKRCSTQLKNHVGESALEKGNVRFLDCVVDQVCNDTLLAKEVTVKAESFREWIIESDEKSSISEILTHPSITILNGQQDAPIELYETRKLWLFNGLHLSLAVLGYKQNETTLFSQLIENESIKIRNLVEGLKNELVEAFFQKDGGQYFTKDEIKAYGDKVLERLTNSPDDCKRVVQSAVIDEDRVKKLTKNFANELVNDNTLSNVIRHSLHEGVFVFFGKAYERIYEPIAELKKAESYQANNLNYVLQLLIPFMVEQGKNLVLNQNS